MKKFLLTLAAAMLLAAPATKAFDLKDLIQKAGEAREQNKNQTQNQTQNPSQTQNQPAATQGQSSNQGGSALGGILGGLLGGSGKTSDDASDNGSSSTSGLGALGQIIKGVISSSDVTVADMTGEWKYNGPAFAFESDNLLQKAGGAAASAAITAKLEPYYKQAGIDQLKASFYPDSTFVFTTNRATVSGSFTPAGEGTSGDYVFTFKAFGKMSLGSMHAHVEKAGSRNLTVTFDVSKLIKVIDAVAKFSGRKSLQAASDLLKSYDGLQCGFELKQTSAAPAEKSSR